MLREKHTVKIRNYSMINYNEEVERKSRTYQLHERIKKAIEAPKISDDYQITFTIKKKKWKKALRILKITILFIHRLRMKVHDLKRYGVSKTVYNPNYRNYKQVRLAMIPSIGNDTKSNKIILNGKIVYKTKYLFYPHHIGIMLWNILNLVFIIYFLTFMPYFLIFNIETRFINVFEYIIDIYFIIDVFINFNLTHMTESGMYEQSRKKIVIKYLKTYFIVDLITSVPIGWILQAFYDFTSSYNKILRILKLPKLISTLKMAKIFKPDYWLKTLKLGNIWRFRLKVNESLLKTIWVATLTYMVLHIAACIFIGIGQIESYYPHSWLVHTGLVNKSQTEIYISSIYYSFVVLTTVGYGDVFSQNTAERFFTLTWMLVGIAFYSYTISFITQFFASNENRNSLLEKRLLVFEKFVKSKKISEELAMSVVQSLEYASTKISYRWLEGNLDIFKSMPLELRYDFLKELHQELFKCPFFKTNDPSFAVRIISLLKPIKLEKGEFLWKKGETSNYIIFITKGDMFSMIENPYYNAFKKTTEKKNPRKTLKSKFKNLLGFQKNKKKRYDMKRDSGIKTVEEPIQEINNMQDLLAQKLFAFKLFSVGSYIGEEEIIYQSQRKYYLKAANYCELMILSREDFDNVLKKEFPHIYDKICKINDKRKEDNYDTKKKLMKFITATARKLKINLIRENMDVNIKKTLKKLENADKNRKSKKLFEFYQDCNLTNPVEDLVRDIKINEYEPNDDPDLHEKDKEEFRKIKTPGLVKLFTDWRSKLISS